MKNVLLKPVSFQLRLLKPLLVFVLLIPGIFLKSQESSTRSTAVYPVFGLGFGFFSPGDVNKYIEASLPSGYVNEMGSEDIFMFLDLHAGLTFRMKRFDITAMAEYDIAPKFIMITNGDDLSFNFSRFAPGILANLYVPVGSGKHAFFLGGGVNYSIMNFEKFSASAPGFRFQLGFSLQFGKFNLQPFGAFNYASATDDSDEDLENFDMDYTNGQIGVNLSFHPAINYK